MSFSGTRKVLDQPKMARKAVGMILEKKTNREIARVTGVSRETVIRWKNREDIREWINEQAQKYIESLPDALSLSKNVIDISKKQTDKAIARDEFGNVTSVNTEHIDQRILDSALREVDNVRKAVGITPSHSTSVVIGQLVMGDNHQVLAPNVQSLLDMQMSRALDITPPEDGDILDVDCEVVSPPSVAVGV